MFSIITTCYNNTEIPENETIFDHNETLCGSSTIDICSSNTFSMGSDGLIPSNTTCQWSLQCNDTFSIDLRLEINDAAEIVVRAMINGTMELISGNSGRNLDSRRALTTTEVFSIEGANSAEILFRNLEDFNNTILTAKVCPYGEISNSNSSSTID